MLLPLNFKLRKFRILLILLHHLDELILGVPVQNLAVSQLFDALPELRRILIALLGELIT
jgi:hypothetical protein